MCGLTQDFLDAQIAKRKVAAERLEEMKAAAAALLLAKGSAGARKDDYKACKEAAILAKRVLAAPPAPLELTAQPKTEGDNLRVLTLDQLLDYSPNDTKVRNALL